MTGSIVTFRYRHDPIAGWGFAPEGESPIELFTEFTTGYLRLSGFGSGPVVGHIRKKGQFFVLHKPADRDEIKGCRLSHEDYARRGFDPFAVAIEALGALVPETTERPRGDGPWIAEGRGSARAGGISVPEALDEWSSARLSFHSTARGGR